MFFWRFRGFSRNSVGVFMFFVIQNYSSSTVICFDL